MSTVGLLPAVEVLWILWHERKGNSLVDPPRLLQGACFRDAALRKPYILAWVSQWEDQGGVLREIKPVNHLKGRHHPKEFAFGLNKCRSRSLVKLSSQKLASGQ